VTKAAEGGQAEVQVAQLATERATNPDVKQFAEKLVTDHTKANAELSSLASSKNVKVDQDNDKDHLYKKLEKKSGNDFDREFVEEMVDDHEKDIKMFEKAASDAKDADVRNFASKTLPTLREHLQIVEGLRSSVMPTGREDSSSGRNLSTTGSTNSSTTSGSYNSGSSSNNNSSVNGTTGTSKQTSGSTSSDTAHHDSTH
jgi:putative membrane protein